jgi:hypothetical protein
VGIRKHEAGEGKAGFLIALAVIGIAAFLGVKIIPVRVTAYQFKDYIEEECRFAAIRGSDAEVRKHILEKARELEIPLDKDGLTLERTRSHMTIAASYQQPVDLKLTTYVYKFSHSYKAPLF